MTQSASTADQGRRTQGRESFFPRKRGLSRAQHAEGLGGLRNRLVHKDRWTQLQLRPQFVPFGFNVADGEHDEGLSQISTFDEPFVLLFPCCFRVPREREEKMIELSLGQSRQIWKANRRNYRISIREKQQPRAKTRRDWAFLAVIMVVALAVVAIPISILIWLVRTRLR
jgi:hypothetical protein